MYTYFSRNYAVGSILSDISITKPPSACKNIKEQKTFLNMDIHIGTRVDIATILHSLNQSVILGVYLNFYIILISKFAQIFL